MNILRIAAFSHNNQGGNPAGVVICQEMPSKQEMLAIAKQVGYSETAFLTRVKKQARYVRKTLSFSKKAYMHHLVTRWFIVEYNLSIFNNRVF